MSETATKARSARQPTTAEMDLRRRLDARLTVMEAVRLSWWRHWQQLAEYILPRRFRWLVSQTDWQSFNRGSPINQKIINSTGTLCARNLASGMMAGTTSPARPWFRMTVPDADISEDVEVRQWCDEVTKRMMRVMNGSGYYTAKAVQYYDLGVFGTAPLIIYEDDDDVIRCFNPVAGEYFCAVSKNNIVDTLARCFTMTVQQMVQEFGIEVLSDGPRAAADARGPRLDEEFIIGHMIEPNPNYNPRRGGVDEIGLSRTFRYREVYWERQAAAMGFLSVKGYIEKPFNVGRWDVSGNDPYGRSPGMDALGDIKQLQLEEKRKAQAIDKMVNPPMIADVSMKNEPASLLPGAINYVAMQQGKEGFRPAYLVNPQIHELKEDIKATEARVKDCFFNDLFLMISNLETVRTATEIDARREEKLIMLGPVLERNEHEVLQQDISRIFQIMARRGLFPPVPEIMEGLPLKVEYIGLLADLQRSSTTTGIERLWQFAGNLGAARPAVLDNLDEDETVKIYAEQLRVPPKVLSSAQRKRMLREQRAKATEEQQQMQAGATAVQGAKVLSETEVGGGQNALQMMLEGGAVPTG